MHNKKSWKKHYKSKNKKGLFGGKIRTQEEIQELNKKIDFHEAKQAEAAEDELDNALKDL
mgnify:CR=1 FL=1